MEASPPLDKYKYNSAKRDAKNLKNKNRFLTMKLVGEREDLASLVLMLSNHRDMLTSAIHKCQKERNGIRELRKSNRELFIKLFHQREDLEKAIKQLRAHKNAVSTVVNETLKSDIRKRKRKADEYEAKSNPPPKH